MKKTWFFIALALGVRFLSLIPSIIDDDEAWFSASAAALKHPFEFYQRALDNKPPGTVWFYEWVQGFEQGMQDPHLVRFVFILLMISTSFLIAKLAATRRAAFYAGFSFFIVSALPSPKLLSVTNEGLMLPLLALAIGAALLPLKTGRKMNTLEAVVSGLSIGAACLVKQTAVLFLLPIVVCAIFLFRDRKLGVVQVLFWVLSFVVPVAFCVNALGLHDFIYWNYQYPREVLVHVRRDLFSQGTDLLVNSVLYVLILWPVVLGVFNSRKAARSKPHLVLWAWLLSAALSVVAGSGLFFHYYLLLAPPLCLLAAETWVKRPRLSSLETYWLGFFYGVSCLIAAVPWSGVFWGNDLIYYGKLSEKIQKFSEPSQPIFVWGGNASALTLSQRNFATEFVNSKWVMSPYSTPWTEAQFRDEFLASPPVLFVDLHERGDNQFSYGLERVPWLQKELGQNYQRSSDPSLPWAYFYRRDMRVKDQYFHSESLAEYESFTRRMGHLFERTPADLIQIFVRNRANLQSWDKFLRAWMSVEYFIRSRGQSVETRLLTQEFHRVFAKVLPCVEAQRACPRIENAETFTHQVLELYQSSNISTPFPIANPLWWASFAVVKLQSTAH